MLSRAANSIYWMSRYLERADNVARFIEVNIRLILDMGWERETAQWEPLVHTTSDEENYLQHHNDYSEKNVVYFLTFDQDNPNSIISCIEKARENARCVQEVISSQLWESINALYHLVQTHKRKRKINDLQQFYKEIHIAIHLFAGLIDNAMSHDEGWHFARVGKLLERADKTTRMLDVKYFLLLPKGEQIDSPHDTVEWGAVLKSVSAFEMYRKQFHRVNYRDVYQFLILDRYFPRSIRFCINTVAQSLNDITETLGVKVPVTEQINQLKKTLDQTEIDVILKSGMHDFIDHFQLNLNAIDQSIYRSFFAIEKEHFAEGVVV